MSKTEKQPMKIASMIAQLEELIEASPRAKFGGGKRMVDADAMLDLLGDMKVTIPEDIRRAQSVLLDEAALMTLARDEAESIRANAEREFEARVSEHAILSEVQRRADELLTKAEDSARQIVQGSRQYADNILIDIQRYLHDYFKIIDQNRQELAGQYQSTPLVQTYEDRGSQEADSGISLGFDAQGKELDVDLEQNG